MKPLDTMKDLLEAIQEEEVHQVKEDNQEEDQLSSCPSPNTSHS